MSRHGSQSAGRQILASKQECNMGAILWWSTTMFVSFGAGLAVGWLFFPMPAFIAKLLGKKTA